jgi:hypothetical protein
MGGVCCARRENEHDFMENGVEGKLFVFLYSLVIILTDKRLQFKTEILKAINKEKLHNEVLQDQNVFDFESYKQMMGLVTVYVTELTLMKNQKSFS